MTQEIPMKIEANLIGDNWAGADSGACIDVINPANGQVIGSVPNCGAEETKRAIEAAKKAFESYSRTDLSYRVKLLFDLHDAILDNVQVLAELLTAEQGKPLAEARGEVSMSASYIRWFAEEVRHSRGEIIPAPTADRRFLVSQHPVGVVGAVTPWNFPSSMLARKLGPALAVGCTVIAKPATATPYSGIVWGKLCQDVGFPAGVVNILTGSASGIVGAMMESTDVRKITFTGSTEIGKKLIRQAADSVKKVSMELGGNAPFIVFDDADLDAAIEGAIASKFRNSGQTCVCTNRFYVQAGIYDAFMEKLNAATQALKVGVGTQDGVQQGPLIDGEAVERMEELISDAEAKGAKVMCGGHRIGNEGCFFEPTVLAEARADMLCAKDEIFGPLCPVFRFETEQEAYDAANGTDYGLAAYAYTRDLGRAVRINDALDYGLIGINSGMITAVEAPFGGLKQSGLGKEGGAQGLNEYLEAKYVCLSGLDS